MKVNVDSNEWYPVLSINNDDGVKEIELTQEELDFIIKAYNDFKISQKLLLAKAYPQGFFN